MTDGLRPLGPRLESALEALPGELRRQLRLQADWEAAVGADIAAHAVPAGVVGTTLHVRADSEAWAGTLRRFSRRLLATLASATDHHIECIEVRVAARAGAARRAGLPEVPPEPATLPAGWHDVIDGVDDVRVKDALRGMLQAYANARFDR